MIKECAICGKSIETKDPRKLYCSNSCKQDSFRQRHSLDKPSFLTAPIKKVDAELAGERKAIPETERVESDKRFVSVSEAIVELNSKIYRLQLQKENLLAKIATLETKRSVLGDVVDGIKQGEDLSQQWRDTLGSNAASKIVVALGLLGGFQRVQNTNHDQVNQKNKIKARLRKAELRELDEQLNELISKRIYMENGLTQLKKEIKSELSVTLNTTKIESHKALNLDQSIDNSAVTPRRDDNRIITLSELKAQEFDVYEFSNGFDESIGNPAKNFAMVLYGESGQGKSTWVIEFANYLAENHGRVLYNSSEERISQSLKRKLLKYDSENFAIAECQTYKALKQAIRGNGFNFIVIDSINDMNIKPNELSELAERNPDKAFIFIMQATKQGNYKGSSQFVHDADVLIKLDNYQPIVEKTRYR